MLTDSKQKTKEIIRKFVTDNPDFEKLRSEILGKFDVYANELRKLIEPCTVTKTDSKYQVTIGKANKPHTILNYPIEEAGKLIFIEEG
jgi:hypothetical protein